MSLPPEIQFEPLLPDGARYVLPKRDLGPLRKVALVMVAVGVIVELIAAATVVRMLPAAGAGPEMWMRLLFAGPFLLSGLFVIGFGMLVFGGHSEIELSRGQLRSIERSGLLRWTRRRSTQKLRALTVVGASFSGQAEPNVPSWMARLGMIAALFDTRNPKRQRMGLAMGYPREWLEPLAQELAERCGIESGIASSDLSEFSSEVQSMVLAGGAVPFDDVQEQPSGSKIVVERHGDGATYHIPPVGIGRGKGGLFFFGVLWSVIVGAITAAMFLIDGGEPVPLFAQFIIGLFWCIGLGLMLAGFHRARRRAVLAVVGGTLMVMQKGPLGSKQGEWRRDQLQSIRIGPSGMEVNDRPILELQVTPREGKKLGLLSERDDRELAWLASQLRQQMQLE